MSFKITIKDWAEVLTTSRYSRWTSSRSVSRARSVIPITPFMGVLISWLMLARNSLLALLAAWAWRVARRSASSISVRSVISTMLATKPVTSPDALVIGALRNRP